MEHGDIIEATAITLIAYPEGDRAGSLEQARSVAARQIFGGSPSTIPQDALPLAMLAIDRGTVRWIDMPMVRRETGADTPLQVSLGARPRAVSESYLLQYQSQLADISTSRQGQGMAFPANEYFGLLPPAGPMPVETIAVAADGLEQMWMPSGIEMSASFVPEDEIAAIMEESLTLPPLDISADAKALEGTAVSALIPVPRNILYRFSNTLANLTTKLSSASNELSSSRPLASLESMLLRRSRRSRMIGNSGGGTGILTAEEQAQLDLWKEALTEALGSAPRDANNTPYCYYARRRSVPYAGTLAGHAVTLKVDSGLIRIPTIINRPFPILTDIVRPRPGLIVQPVFDPTPLDEDRPDPAPTPAPDEDDGRVVNEELADKRVAKLAVKFGLKTRFTALKKSATASAQAAMTQLLSAKMIGRSPALFVNAIHDLEIAAPSITSRTGEARSRLIEISRSRRRPDLKKLSDGDVAGVAADYRRDDLGKGLRILAEMTGMDIVNDKPGMWLGDTGFALEMDEIGVKFPERQLKKLAEPFAKAVKEQDEKMVARIAKKFLGR